MSKCKHLIDISPYTPLCEHPCRLYGGGPVEAKCDACEYRTESLEAENAKLRELVRMMWKPFCWAQSGYDVCLNDEQDKAIRDLVHELEIEVDG